MPLRRLRPAPLAAFVAIVFLSSTATAAVRTVEEHRSDGERLMAGPGASGEDARGAGPRPARSPRSGASPATAAPTTAPAPAPPGTAAPAPVAARPTSTAPPPRTPATGATKPAPTRAAPPSTLGPRNPGAVVFPYQPGQSSWEGVSNGITLRVRIDPVAPRVGDPVRFVVEASSPDRPCCGVSVQYGDGASRSWKMEWTEGSCDTAAPGVSRAEYTHGYNREGRWEFAFSAVTGRCGVDNVYGSLHGYLEVAPGQARSQGPSLPTVKLAEARAPDEPREPGFLKVWAQGADDDGYVSRFLVDFADGTPVETLPGDPMGCRPTRSGWPSRSLASFQPPYPSHRYAAPGTYAITVTVVSTGCDGGEEQTASAAMTYAW